MAAHSWAASALILFHLAALSLAAIPDPVKLRQMELRPRAQPDPLAAIVTPALDRASAWLTGLETTLFALARPVRTLTQPYVNGGVPQRWIMFSTPWTDDQYVRLDYYVASGARSGAPRVFRELVLPGQNEGHVRLIHKFSDKAIVGSLDAYRTALAKRYDSGDWGEGSGDSLPPSEVTALMRHFRARFRDGSLAADEDVVRIELWYGEAPIPPPGKTVGAPVVRTRLDILAAYRDGVPDGVAVTPYPRRWTTYREADITWRLIYVAES